MRHYDEDLIDFPVADCWRDHYAAQGMTYPSGLRASQTDPPRHTPPDEHGSLGELLAMLRDQERKIAALTAEIARIKAQQNKGDSHDSFEGLE